MTQRYFTYNVTCETITGLTTQGHILVYEKLIFLDNLYINLPINY